MKQLFRAVVMVLLVGGWTLAGSALHVVRTPTSVVVIPKDRLRFADTYVDTRKWTLVDDRAHPVVVARLLATGHANLLAHTVDTTNGMSVDAQLNDAVSHPTAAQPNGAETTVDKVEGELKNAGNLVKSKLPKI